MPMSFPPSALAGFWGGSGSIASPIATLTGITAGLFTGGKSNLSIPAGTFKVGDHLTGGCKIRRTTATAVHTANIYMGTAGTSSDSNLSNITTSGATINFDQNMYFLGSFPSTTVFSTNNNAPFNANNTAGLFVDRSTNMNIAAAMTLSFGISVGNASDSYSLIEWWLMQYTPMN